MTALELFATLRQRDVTLTPWVDPVNLVNDGDPNALA